ncbi:MAG: type II CAAX prenyl endopeptidase Rce1 family protein [Leptolyngbyaceae cyanobacterium]
MDSMTRRDRHRLVKKMMWVGLLCLGLVTTQLVSMRPAPADIPVSNYDLAQAATFNQVTTYPLTSLPSAPSYRPLGDWLGRLILPSAADYAADPGDWAWMEVWHAPEASLLGQTVKVTWRESPALERYVVEVTRDVQFTEKAEKFGAGSNLVPTRLNGRQAVGPLQSLAGARPQDDVTVKLVGNPTLRPQGEMSVVEIGLEPVQITGREYGLVRLLAPDTGVDVALPTACPGALPCPTEYFKVQHFDATAAAFTGSTETIRIPQQPQLQGDRFFSNIRDLIDAPAGVAGWYVYGARDESGGFTVQSLQPRQLVQLRPDQVILGEKPGRHYLDRDNWQDTPARKGTVQRVLVSPTAESEAAAIANWQAGDNALVIHVFGGIGGDNQELTPAGTVSGHFAYGLAQVVVEPIAQELQFKINYQQIYAHNSGGIISGTHDWSSYAGDMQRGWLGQRPFSDIVVKLDYFTEPLQLGPTRLSLFEQLLIQTQVIAARYRTGDGTGVATVTPATSCVQDSSQAMFIAIEQIRAQAAADPTLQTYIQDHPDDPEVQKIDQFATLATNLHQALSPYGVIRRDWESNAEELAGVNARGNELATDSGLVAGIFSWRTMMPRWGQDDIADIFLKNGADLWFLRPNQIGGFDPTIAPIPPTALFGLIPVVSRVALRAARSFAVPWWSTPLLVYSGLALLLIAVVIPVYGCKSGYLEKPRIAVERPVRAGFNLVKLLLLPALLEELIFRVGLLPHLTEGVATGPWLAWAALSLGLYVLAHVVFSQLRPQAAVALRDRRFLLMVLWLGLVLTTLYGLTGSLFAVTLVHWLTVVAWLYGFGGLARLRGEAPTAA